jgi:hypothetical protein
MIGSPEKSAVLLHSKFPGVVFPQLSLMGIVLHPLVGMLAEVVLVFADVDVNGFIHAIDNVLLPSWVSSNSIIVWWILYLVQGATICQL